MSANPSAGGRESPMMTVKTAKRGQEDLLGIYLNDHLAGSLAGLELARRMAGAAEPGSESASVLARLVTELAKDRAALLEIMAALGIGVRGYKMFAAWAGEKAGRMKLNGRLATRSPLSGLEEAEVLRLGIEGKAAGWRTLRALADRDGRLDAARLDALLARAASQSEAAETLRMSGAERILAGTAG
jgi:hypothetical protein